MLQNIGDALKGKKTLSWLILVPLGLVFAIWGATGAVSLDFFGPKTYAAKVDGKEIEAREATEAYQNAQSEWLAQMGQDMPEDVRLTTQSGVIERLIRQQLVLARGDEGYRVGATRLEEAIRSEPAFQVEGRYDETLALARLAQVGLSANDYRRDLRRSLQAEALQRTLAAGEFVTPTEVGRQFALEDEQREVRYAVLDTARLKSQVRLSEQDLEKWYAANGEIFSTAATVDLDYAEISLAALSAATPLDEAAVQGLYAENRDKYREPERRRARHILVADEATAKKLLGRLQAGEDFAKLAKEFSTDTGSAPQGGDLGFSERSVFVAPFADAVFAMKPGELRGPVKTEFGFHVIRLEEIAAGRERPFEEVRAELETSYRSERASDRFSEMLDTAQRRLESPGGDLAGIAKELNLEIRQVAGYARGGAGTPLAGFPALDEAVFRSEFLSGSRVGGPVELNQDRVLLFRVRAHRPSVVPPLASVRARAEEIARTERAQALAREAAAKFVAAVRGGGNVDAAFKDLGSAAPAARNISRNDPSVPGEIRSAVFAAARPKQGAVAVATAATNTGDAAVFVLQGVRTVTPDTQSVPVAQRVSQLRNRVGQSVLAGYIEDMRERADVKVNPSVFQ